MARSEVTSKMPSDWFVKVQAMLTSLCVAAACGSGSQNSHTSMPGASGDGGEGGTVGGSAGGNAGGVSMGGGSAGAPPLMHVNRPCPTDKSTVGMWENVTPQFVL